MRTRMIAVLIGLPLALTGCGNQNAGGSTPGKENFEERARQAIAAWEALGKAKAWTSGFVPLEEFTVLPRDPGFTDATRLAYRVGAYRLSGRLPGHAPRRGLIRWPGGKTFSVPLINAEQAYEALDKGPMSKAAPGERSVGTKAPDTVGASAVPCPECDLTVTGARLVPIALHTSQGIAQVPAWWFTVPELKSPVVRVAVRPEAAGTLPSPSPVPGGTPVYGVDAVPGNPLKLFRSPHRDVAWGRYHPGQAARWAGAARHHRQSDSAGPAPTHPRLIALRGSATIKGLAIVSMTKPLIVSRLG